MKKSKVEKAAGPDEASEIRQRFIRALAEYLVDNQAVKNIELEMGKSSAKEWAKLRAESPLFGYPTVDEAEEQLTKFLAGA